MLFFQQIPENSASILISPPLEGKREFLYNYMLDGLKNQKPVLFILTDRAPEEVKRDLVKNKIFYDQYTKDNILKFIDCYSHQSACNVQDTADVMRIPGPLALNEISIALSKTEAEFYKINPKHLVIFDSLSTVLMYSNPQMIGRFLQVIISRIKKAGGSVIFTLEEGMHDEKATITIEHLMDIIINFKKEKEKILVKAKGIEGFDEWTEF